MEDQFRYFIVGKFIIRTLAWKVNRHNGRYATYLETNRALWERASKYGFTALTL